MVAGLWGSRFGGSESAYALNLVFDFSEPLLSYGMCQLQLEHLLHLFGRLQYEGQGCVFELAPHVEQPIASSRCLKLARSRNLAGGCQSLAERLKLPYRQF
jgi:hypothetical protein